MPNTQTILTIIFCIVDELVKRQIRTPRPGAPPKLSDSELIALIIYKELAGIECERQFLRIIRRDYLYLFPNLIGQSQFNRRAKSLCPLIERLRQDLLNELGAYAVEFTVIDSTPVPVKQVVRAVRTKKASNIVGFGHRFVHGDRYYGTKLHILINRYGVPTTAMVTLPSVHDSAVVTQMLENRTNLVLLGDKAYRSDPLREQLFMDQSIILVAPAKKHPGHTNTDSEIYALRKGRLLIESVINMLKNHLQLHRILATSEIGLKARIHRKLTAFVMAIYINRILKRPALAVKSLAA